MLDLVIKLIDRCIQLVGERKKQNRSLFVDFVEPLIADFKEVHQDYLASFAKYREHLSEAGDPVSSIEKLVEQVDIDALFSANGRANVFWVRTSEEDKALGSLLESIRLYLGYAITNRYEEAMSPMSNVRRSGFKARIKDLANDRVERSDDEIHKEALKILDSTVLDLQKRYNQVINSANKVKRELLLD